MKTRRPHFLRAWREHLGRNQDEVAAAARISRSNYSRVERGLIPYNQDILEALSQYYDLPVSVLIETAPWDYDPDAEAVLSTLGPEGRRALSRMVAELAERARQFDPDE